MAPFGSPALPGRQSHSATVPGPAGTVFENNAHLKAMMSNTSPNKIVIDGELITGITGPDNAYKKANTADGALLITLPASESEVTRKTFLTFGQ